jgi:iron complex outermembrane receptor protein
LLGSPGNGSPIFPNLAFIATICDGTPGNYGGAACAAKRAEFLALAGTNTAGAIATNDIYGYYDVRVTNLGNARVSGLDWSIQYNHPMDWGSIYGSLSGAVLLTSESQALPGQPFISNLTPGNAAGTQSFGLSTHRISGRLGATYDGFRGQLTWNHNSGYDLNPTAVILQNHVGAFDVFNLFLSYNFKGSGITDDLKLTLNIDNVLNSAPPIYRTTNTGDGYINGSTLGRIFKIGFEKKF